MIRKQKEYRRNAATVLPNNAISCGRMKTETICGVKIQQPPKHSTEVSATAVRP